MGKVPTPIGRARKRADRAGGPSGDPFVDLMAQARRGDADAFAALYDGLGGAVYGLVRRILRDPSMTEEVTQEVFIEVWRRAASFDPERGTVTAWTMTLAHRRAVDRVRSEQADRDRQIRAAQGYTEPAVDVVADEVERSLDHQRVRRALDGLTAVQREAVELAYYRGNTYREVAQLLDVPLGTVKTRLRDGLIRLRDQLGVST